MAGDPRNPQVGELVIDASELAAILIDLPPGALRSMCTEQEGFGDVLQEIITNQPVVGDKAGVTAGDATTLHENTVWIARIDQFLPAVAKLHEILVESRYSLDDERQRLAFAVAVSVDRRSRTSPELVAKYEKTRAYRSAAAKKGWKTRRKKAAEAAANAPK